MKTLKFASLFLVLILCFAFYIVQSTGFFRTIENRFDGKIKQKIDVVGAEDMQIDYEAEFLLISSDDRAGHRDGNSVQGALYKIDLTDPSLTPLKLPTTYSGEFYPHGISMKRLNDSVHRVLAVNHVRSTHSIELFDLKNDTLQYIRTLKDETMVSPNDVVALDNGRFYYTNDHGNIQGFKRMLEEYLGLRASNVGYFDGERFREVADGIAYANGVNYDASRNLLFVASPRGFLVKVYEVRQSGELIFRENIDCGTGVDNIEFDPNGKIWIGSHPSLLHFASYSQAKKDKAPSEIVTIDYRGEGDFSVESIYLEDGSDMSAATVAVPYRDLIFLGNVMDDHLLVLSQ